MGYTTDFRGTLKFNRPLTDEEKNYINALAETRRVKRDVKKLMELYDGEHGNPFATEKTAEAIYGLEGEYFVDDNDSAGVIDYNCPPGQKSYGSKFNGKGQPGLHCQWIINEDGELEWDGNEKFYSYIEWLHYLINHFFSKLGLLLNGEIEWEGEESSDLGKIIVVDNVISTKTGTIVYTD